MECQTLSVKIYVCQFYIADSTTYYLSFFLDSQGDHNFIVCLNIDRMSGLHSEIVNLSTLTLRDNRDNAPEILRFTFQDSHTLWESQAVHLVFTLHRQYFTSCRMLSDS